LIKLYRLSSDNRSASDLDIELEGKSEQITDFQKSINTSLKSLTNLGNRKFVNAIGADCYFNNDSFKGSTENKHSNSNYANESTTTQENKIFYKKASIGEFKIKKLGSEVNIKKNTKLETEADVFNNNKSDFVSEVTSNRVYLI